MKYIYECKKCNVAKEIEHKVNEKKIPTCDICLGQMTKTIIFRRQKNANLFVSMPKVQN